MTQIAWAGLAANLVVTLIVTLVLISATFLIALRRRHYDTVDVFWGLGFAVIGVLSFSLSAGSAPVLPRALIAACSVLWGLRLATHIYRRNRGHDEDPRYQAMARKHQDNVRTWMFVRVYLVQAALMWIISLPLQAGQYGRFGIGVVGWIGLAVWLVGIVFETLGDHQLTVFKRDQGNQGKVLDTGLWRFTRHPNYFGDATVWWGLYLLACANWAGVATVFAPLIMTALLAKGTGKPMLERSMMRRRPAYADYVQRTSGFFPLPPRKVAADTNG
jgi:steroid 5-alpha reductase family enzyme